MVSSTSFTSPLGVVVIEATDDYITKIRLQDETTELLSPETEILQQCKRELLEYFDGKRFAFTFKHQNNGTEFRKIVWQELEKIPYGTTATYKDIAINAGNPKAVRAVGGANHHNNIWIVVPCHRIIGANGSLTGYGGGLWRKQWLLEHEAKHNI